MNENAEGAYYYTRHGERMGPVSLSELRTKAGEAALDPRLDMVWSPGMEDWKPAGEIEGLFEKRVPEEKESLAPSAGPYTPPKQDPAADALTQGGTWPGARRRIFLTMTIVFPFIWSFLFGFIGAFFGSQLGPDMKQYLNLGAGIVPLIVGVYFSLMRLVNLGMSRWWYLANLVPFLNLWIGFRCFACPAGYALHKKLDGPGVALAILYWLLVVVGILIVAAVIALFFGAVDNPELQEQIREAIRTLREPGTAP